MMVRYPTPGCIIIIIFSNIGTLQTIRTSGDTFHINPHRVNFHSPRSFDTNKSFVKADTYTKHCHLRTTKITQKLIFTFFSNCQFTKHTISTYYFFFGRYNFGVPMFWRVCLWFRRLAFATGVFGFGLALTWLRSFFFFFVFRFSETHFPCIF